MKIAFPCVILADLHSLIALTYFSHRFNAADNVLFPQYAVKSVWIYIMRIAIVVKKRSRVEIY